jgi:hypothetical protein
LARQKRISKFVIFYEKLDFLKTKKNFIDKNDQGEWMDNENGNGSFVKDIVFFFV